MGRVQGGWHERRHFKVQHHIGLLRRGLEIDTSQAALLGLLARLAGRQRVTGNAAVVFLSQRADLRHIDIARHHNHGIGRCVPALEKAACIIGRHGFQITHPSQHRTAVGCGLPGRGLHHFLQPCPGVVFRTHATLFFNHLHLFVEFLIAPLVVGKAVGFELHYLLEPGRWNLLEKTGVVKTGKGVFTPAQRRHTARKIARFHTRRALEHHVLEHVGDAGRAIDFVHGADPHPHHVHCGRRAVIGLDDQGHAVFQRDFHHLRGLGGRCGYRNCRLRQRRRRCALQKQRQGRGDCQCAGQAFYRRPDGSGFT